MRISENHLKPLLTDALAIYNPIYTGRVRHGGEIYPGEHERVISKAYLQDGSSVKPVPSPRPLSSKLWLSNSPGELKTPLHDGKD